MAEIPGPTLREALELHDQHRPPAALESVLFDGYLIDTQLIYRNLREETLAQGCSYTTEDFCSYDALKLAALSAMLDQRKIPYFDNVTVLRGLERLRPGRFLFSDISDLRKNYLLHESAHLVADSLLKKRIPSMLAAGPDPALAQARGRVLGLNLVESFANTVELLQRLAIRSEVDHQIFDWNTYAMVRPKVAPAFHEVEPLVGARVAAKMILLGYLHSNFLHDGAQPERVRELLELVDPGKGPRPVVVELFHTVLAACFRLNRGFRVQTQAFYLKFLGIEGELTALLAFDFLRAVRETPELPALVNDLTEVICRGRGADQGRQFHGR